MLILFWYKIFEVCAYEYSIGIFGLPYVPVSSVWVILQFGNSKSILRSMVYHFITIKMSWYQLTTLFPDGIFSWKKEMSGRKNYFASIWILSTDD